MPKMFDSVSPSFFAIQIEGDLAADLAEQLAPTAGLDIEMVTMVSKELPSDIHAINEMCRAVDALKKKVQSTMEVVDTFNPLFLPKAVQELDEQIDIDGRSDAVRFLGMDGNPFVVRKIEVKVEGETVIDARVGVEQFDLPAYSDMMNEKQNLLLN